MGWLKGKQCLARKVEICVGHKQQHPTGMRQQQLTVGGKRCEHKHVDSRCRGR